MAGGVVVDGVVAEARAQEVAHLHNIGAVGAARVADHHESHGIGGRLGVRHGGAERRCREQRDEGSHRSSANDYGHTPSSVALLQLSSIPLQTSDRGSTSPAHPVGHAPAVQVWVPPRQIPWPIVPPGPV